MFTIDEFVSEFKPKLFGTRRWAGFLTIANHLQKKDTLEIFEVGCIRTLDGWESDGQSTRVWNWMAQTVAHPKVRTVDKSVQAMEMALKECPWVGGTVADGIEILKDLDVSKLDLLFLDGMDFTGPHAIKAWLQHINLLLVCWERLPKGCWIVVDDCQHKTEGKHVLIDCFMERLGIKPILESYMTIWEKP